MGLIKGGSFVILCVFLFLTFLVLNSFLTLNLSLSYDNVKVETAPLVVDLANGVPDTLERFDRFNFSDFDVVFVIDENFEKMELNCEEYGEYVFVFGGQTIVVPCSYLDDGKDAVVNKTVSDFIEGAYYKDYDCGFFDCLSKENHPFFIVSQEAKDFWNGKFYFALLTSLILIGLLFFFAETRAKFLIVVGGLMVLASVSFSKIIQLVFSIFSFESLKVFSLFFHIFFSESGKVAMIFLVLGFLVLGSGIAYRIWSWDSVKRKFSRRDVSKIVREEVEKGKSEIKGV